MKGMKKNVNKQGTAGSRGILGGLFRRPLDAPGDTLDGSVY
jgi:hypothetical protein